MVNSMRLASLHAPLSRIYSSKEPIVCRVDHLGPLQLCHGIAQVPPIYRSPPGTLPQLLLFSRSLLRQSFLSPPRPFALLRLWFLEFHYEVPAHLRGLLVVLVPRNERLHYSSIAPRRQCPGCAIPIVRTSLLPIFWRNGLWYFLPNLSISFSPSCTGRAFCRQWMETKVRMISDLLTSPVQVLPRPMDRGFHSEVFRNTPGCGWRRSPFDPSLTSGCRVSPPSRSVRVSRDPLPTLRLL